MEDNLVGGAPKGGEACSSRPGGGAAPLGSSTVNADVRSAMPPVRRDRRKQLEL
jgi:hypothetical protein